ncbi:MAG: hypothetical protein JJT96_08280 [Opitutales bacterium]|nr:hypothetical protein [Opitutales bacterium]
MKRYHPELIGAAIRIRPYWGWKRALEEAGISYEDIRFAYHATVRCRICGFEGTSLSSHLRFKHGLKPGEYLEKFPGEEVESEQRLYNFFGRRKLVRVPPILPWEKIMTDEYVYDRVAEYRRQKFPITTDFIHRNDRPLYVHAKRSGKSWPEFCAFMGPEYAKEAETPKPPPDPLRSYEETLQALRDIDIDGYLPTERTLKSRYFSIRRDVLRHFANYPAAAKAVGLKISTGHRLPKGARDHQKIAAKYPPEKVIEIMREMIKGDRIPRKRDVKERNPDLLIAITKHFGKMGNLFKAMGLKAERARGIKRRYQDKESIIEEIRRRDEEGLPVNGRALLDGPDRDSGLQTSALRYFGSWKEALEAAGVAMPSRAAKKRDRVPVFATPEAVVEELKRRMAAGEPVRAFQLQQGTETDRNLLLDSRLHFGPHVEALKAAGLRPDGRLRAPPPRYLPTKPKEPRPPRPPTGPSREEVLAFIRDRVEKGEHLNCDRIARAGHSRVTNAARRIFGHWRAALNAAGVDVPNNKVGARAQPKPSREDIIAFMKKRVDDGIGLSSAKLSKESPGYRYYRTAIKVFGSWENALKAAGFDPVEIIARFNPAPKAKPKPPKVPKVKPPPRPLFSKEFILQTMRKRLEENKPALARDIAKEEDGAHFVKSVRAQFGDWKSLLSELGVSGNGRMPPSKEEIIAFLQARVADGKSVASPQLTLTTEGSRIYNAGTKTFGSWHDALRAAGFEPKEILARFKRRPRRLPKFLQPHAPRAEKSRAAAVSDSGEEPDMSASAQTAPPKGSSKPNEFPAREATAAEFARILAAAGADTSEFGDDFETEPEDPEKLRIITALRERASAGKAMKYGVICLGPPALRDRALYDAALNAFGSWKAALEEAGVR